jgi:hypothetical protein
MGGFSTAGGVSPDALLVHANFYFAPVGPAEVIDDTHGDPASSGRMPGEYLADSGLAQEGAIGKPVQPANISGSGGGKRDTGLITAETKGVPGGAPR